MNVFYHLSFWLTNDQNKICSEEKLTLTISLLFLDRLYKISQVVRIHQKAETFLNVIVDFFKLLFCFFLMQCQLLLHHGIYLDFIISGKVTNVSFLNQVLNLYFALILTLKTLSIESLLYFFLVLSDSAYLPSRNTITIIDTNQTIWKEVIIFMISPEKDSVNLSTRFSDHPSQITIKSQSFNKIFVLLLIVGTTFQIFFCKANWLDWILNIVNIIKFKCRFFDFAR